MHIDKLSKERLDRMKKYGGWIEVNYRAKLPTGEWLQIGWQRSAAIPTIAITEYSGYTRKDHLETLQAFASQVGAIVSGVEVEYCNV